MFSIENLIKSLNRNDFNHKKLIQKLQRGIDFLKQTIKFKDLNEKLTEKLKMSGTATKQLKTKIK